MYQLLCCGGGCCIFKGKSEGDGEKEERKKEGKQEERKETDTKLKGINEGRNNGVRKM